MKVPCQGRWASITLSLPWIWFVNDLNKMISTVFLLNTSDEYIKIIYDYHIMCQWYLFLKLKNTWILLFGNRFCYFFYFFVKTQTILLLCGWLLREFQNWKDIIFCVLYIERWWRLVIFQEMLWSCTNLYLPHDVKSEILLFHVE